MQVNHLLPLFVRYLKESVKLHESYNACLLAEFTANHSDRKGHQFISSNLQR
jgi:hypothetical protein